MENRLKAQYEKEIVPALVDKFNYTSVMQVPKLAKIVLNMGVGDAVTNAKNLDEAVEELTLISGQNHWLPGQRNLSLVSVFVKVWQLVPRLTYVANVCMTSWTS